MNIDNMNLTEELILKAGACQTVEELMALARENGIEITPEQLPELMAEVAKKCSGEISDDALEVAGAVGGKASYTDKNGQKFKVVTVGYRCNRFKCKKCSAPGQPQKGEFHYRTCTIWSGSSACTICERMIFKDGLRLCPIL